MGNIPSHMLLIFNIRPSILVQICYYEFIIHTLLFYFILLSTSLLSCTWLFRSQNYLKHSTLTYFNSFTDFSPKKFWVCFVAHQPLNAGHAANALCWTDGHQKVWWSYRSLCYVASVWVKRPACWYAPGVARQPNSQWEESILSQHASSIWNSETPLSF